MQCQVEISSRELIKPSSPTPPASKLHKLSLLDQTSLPTYVPLLFFYRNQNVNDPKNASRHLKQSLSETLTTFYPLAGILTLPHLNSVSCDDSGALFVKAKVDASLSDAIQDAPYTHFAQYLPFHPTSELIAGSYTRNEVLLAVQITWFGCGGSAVGVCAAHKVADLASTLTFLNSWAAASSGVLSRVKKPDFEIGRHIFPPLNNPSSRVSPVPGSGSMVKSQGFLVTRFIFSKEKLIQLKQLASSSSSVVKKPTGVEVVTAFLWKQFMELVPDSEQGRAMSVVHSVNLRSKMRGLIDSKSFPFGSIVINKPLSSDGGSVAYGDLVCYVSDGLREVNQEFVVNSQVPRSVKPGVKPDWFFSSWCRYPTNEVDFGWGEPVSFGPGFMPNIHLVVLITTKDGEGIEAWVALLPHELPLLTHHLLSLADTTFFHPN